MTTSTPAGTAPQPEPLKPIQYLGYACGDAANNLTFTLVSMFLLVYYTDVAGITAAAAGTILLVARVWGRSRTSSPAGWLTARPRAGPVPPYFLFAGVPLMLLSVATFSVSGGLAEGATLTYAYVTYMLFYLVYSLVNIPFGSLASAMTQIPDERAKLSSARSIGAAVAIIGLTVVVAPQISRATDLQRSLTITTLIFAVIGVALYLFVFATSRERVERDTAHVGLRQSLDQVRHNKPLLLLCASTLSVLTGMFVLQTLQVYYARDVLGNADFTILLTVLTTGAMIVVAPAVPKIVEKVGKKRSYLVGGLVTVVGGLGIAVTPPSLLVIALASFAVYGVGIAGLQSLIRALQADTAAGRHRGVRRVALRRAQRGHELRGTVVHPHGRPGHRRRTGRIRHRSRRLRRGLRDPVVRGAGCDPLRHRVRPRAIRRHRRPAHARLPAHRGAVPRTGRRARRTPPGTRGRRRDRLPARRGSRRRMHRMQPPRIRASRRRPRGNQGPRRPCAGARQLEQPVEPGEFGHTPNHLDLVVAGCTGPHRR